MGGRGSSATAPMETMTNNRVYFTIAPTGDLKCISYYDKVSVKNKLTWISHIMEYYRILITDIFIKKMIHLKVLHIWQIKKRRWLNLLMKYGRKRKRMYGPDGKSVIRMTGDLFKEYQRWDEFPEMKNYP